MKRLISFALPHFLQGFEPRSSALEENIESFLPRPPPNRKDFHSHYCFSISFKRACIIFRLLLFSLSNKIPIGMFRFQSSFYWVFISFSFCFVFFLLERSTTLKWSSSRKLIKSRSEFHLKDRFCTEAENCQARQDLKATRVLIGFGSMLG